MARKPVNIWNDNICDLTFVPRIAECAGPRLFIPAATHPRRWSTSRESFPEQDLSYATDPVFIVRLHMHDAFLSTRTIFDTRIYTNS